MSFSGSRNQPHTSPDKLSEVRLQVDQVRDVMASNIEQAILRGEKIDVMEQKSEELNEQSNLFLNRSTRLKRYFYCQNIKRMACIITTVLGVIGIIVLIVVLSNRSS